MRAIQEDVGLRCQEGDGPAHEVAGTVNHPGGRLIGDLGVNLFDLQDLAHGGLEGLLIEDAFVEPPGRGGDHPAENPNECGQQKPEDPHARTCPVVRIPASAATCSAASVTVTGVPDSWASVVTPASAMPQATIRS